MNLMMCKYVHCSKLELTNILVKLQERAIIAGNELLYHLYMTSNVTPVKVIMM